MSINSRNRKCSYYNENSVDWQHNKPEATEEIANELEDRSEEVTGS